MRNPEKAHAFKEKIAGESLAIHISAMDVDSDESVKRGIDAILDEVGTIDVLINNAGIERHGSVEEWVDWNAANDADWYEAVEQTFGLNAKQDQQTVKQ